jgi:aminopeptidase N
MRNFTLIISILSVFFACMPAKKAEKTQINSITATIDETSTPSIYNESRKRVFDLLHTKLDVRFNIPGAELYGKATLSLTPYFYSTSALELDAKGMEFSKIMLEGKNQKSRELSHHYENDILSITLDREYHRGDTIQIFIEYVSRPNARAEGGSAAITSDKGLYFINPQGKEAKKPIQIWTQGETESNSVWFPTIDSPNERMSQELYITVPENFITLSNGLMVFSMENGDGTRTDYWKQDLPHAPYLTMMAIGEYAVVNDKWRNLDVNYYVEKDYEPYAKTIFGNTPEMMEFFSRQLGVDYPWDKYHQVVVRDYVSGAMENTGAVIFGEFMHQTPRELLDDDNESIIAHELYHHWFGDLVTCESWANLPLNESFATYGEYLWIEYKYGRNAADHHLQGNLNQYLAESKNKQMDMIRFSYEDKEDMFDSHSYAKGGRILHMLRKYVGDEAFFESLKLYLNTHKFQSVEIHDLRLAFEKVTGEDLNWFFNQWFLSSGHPELEIKTSFNKEANKAVVKIEQVQNLKKAPLYRLPIEIDIYCNGRVIKQKVTLRKQEEEFQFTVPSKPELINVDAEKMLLCVKKEEKNAEEWAFQYRNTPLFIDRLEAIENLAKSPSPLSTEILAEGLNDKYYNIRLAAIRNTQKLHAQNPEELKEKLLHLSLNDPKSVVRAGALRQLSNYFSKDSDASNTFKAALADSSYQVLAEALAAIAVFSDKEALEAAKALEKEKKPAIINAIAAIYARSGNDTHNQFFLHSFENLSGYNQYSFINLYGKFLKGKSDETINESLSLLENIAISSPAWWVRLSAIQALSELFYNYDAQSKDSKGKIIKANTENQESVKEKISKILSKAKQKETNENLLKILSNF